MNKLNIRNIYLADFTYTFNKARQRLSDVILQFGRRYRWSTPATTPAPQTLSRWPRSAVFRPKHYHVPAATEHSSATPQSTFFQHLNSGVSNTSVQVPTLATTLRHIRPLVGLCSRRKPKSIHCYLSCYQKQSRPFLCRLSNRALHRRLATEAAFQRLSCAIPTTQTTTRSLSYRPLMRAIQSTTM